MDSGGYSIKLRFESEEEAVSWFEELRHDGLVPRHAGLRLQELADVEPPDRDTRLIVADVASEQHPWIVEPVNQRRGVPDDAGARSTPG